MNSLNRFQRAQEGEFGWERALSEVQAGRKLTHWIWYIFPQLKGLGTSYNSSFYGIVSLQEAKDYLNDTVLGARLYAITEVILGLEVNDLREVFDGDSRKVWSSMTLFAIAAGKSTSVFQQVLDRYFEGRLDQRTVAMVTSLN